MAKFRRLRMDELEKLEKEFVRFLAAQSITAVDYQNILVADPQKQLELIDRFSDVVLTKTLSNIKILEQKTPKRLIYFTFYKDHAALHGFELAESQETDLTNFSHPEQIMHFILTNPLHINWLKGIKPYRKEKLVEILEVLENNCLIVQDDSVYQFIRQKFDNAEQG